jgi:DNA-directed RNA polymerase specialized sigma24 family protein
MEIAELYDRLAPQLFAVALRVAGDRNAAASALEETFTALRGYDARFGPPDAWLLRTVRDRALAKQGRTAAGPVERVGDKPTPRELIEEAFYRGRTASDLARVHGLAETNVRQMLRDGITDLRRQLR